MARFFFDWFVFLNLLEPHTGTFSIDRAIAVGKYLVSPLVRSEADGRFQASVSIRSGRGSGMHDRVMRFVPRFAERTAALHYATEQGLCWVQARNA